MAHLGERITDYLVGEMTASEAAEAAEHVGQCADCHRQVEEFKRTLFMLQSVPDAEPPRPLVFEVERKSESWSWLWRWASPAGAAVAASIVTALLMSPRVEPSRPAEQVFVAPASPAVDSQKLATELQASSQAWLAAELEKRDQAREQDLQRLRSELALLESRQLAAKRETFETAATIQLLAQKIP